MLGFQDQELMLGFDLCSLIEAYRSQTPWYRISENIFFFIKIVQYSATWSLFQEHV